MMRSSGDGSSGSSKSMGHYQDDNDDDDDDDKDDDDVEDDNNDNDDDDDDRWTKKPHRKNRWLTTGVHSWGGSTDDQWHPTWGNPAIDASVPDYVKAKRYMSSDWDAAGR